MAELSREERWKRLQEELARPVKLSELEKEKLRSVFEEVRQLLDENLEIIIEADRDDAYRYANLLIQAFNQAESDYADGVGVEEVEEGDHMPPRGIRPPVNLERPAVGSPSRVGIDLGERPDFHGILGQLNEKEREKATTLLDCVKTGLELEGMGEDPSKALCHGLDRHCSVEEMRNCIGIEDPSVMDEMDRDLQARRRGT